MFGGVGIAVSPQAPTHILVIPKKPIPRLSESQSEDTELMGHLLMTVKKVAEQANLSKGYRVGAGVNLGCDYQINNRLRAQAQLQLPYWYHGNSDAAGYRGHYWQPITMLGVQYDIDAKNAIRLEANYEWQERIEKGDDVQLSYRRYF